MVWHDFHESRGEGKDGESVGNAWLLDKSFPRALLRTTSKRVLLRDPFCHTELTLMVCARIGSETRNNRLCVRHPRGIPFTARLRIKRPLLGDNGSDDRSRVRPRCGLQASSINSREIVAGWENQRAYSEPISESVKNIPPKVFRRGNVFFAFLVLMDEKHVKHINC